MVIKKTDVFTLLIIVPLSLCALGFSILFYETQSEFTKLRNDISVNREPYSSETYIDTLLFGPKSSTSMRPRDYLARNAFEDDHSTLLRQQMKRLILAKRLKSNYPDNDLLIHWLSTVYLGHGEYGLSQASKSLFDKNISELSKKETLKIAALIHAPSQLRDNDVLWKQQQTRLKQNLTNAISD